VSRPHDQKRFATLQARAALHGITLHCIDGDFAKPVHIASRWAMTKQLDDLDQVSTWLQMVTGKKGDVA
jgi:hypothetical protein